MTREYLVAGGVHVPGYTHDDDADDDADELVAHAAPSAVRASSARAIAVEHARGGG
jgi:hypothetical protein